MKMKPPFCMAYLVVLVIGVYMIVTFWGPVSAPLLSGFGFLFTGLGGIMTTWHKM